MLVDAAPVEDVREGRPIVVRAGSRDLVLARWNDRIYAVRNVCPHQSQSFESGLVRDDVASDAVGDISALDDHPVLVCPFHRWQYDLKSGRCTTDPSYRIRTYGVTVRDGRVLVDLGPAGRAMRPAPQVEVEAVHE
jgi:nitrite reductase/ring-hydroxylating ferredoxin subunit